MADTVALVIEGGQGQPKGVGGMNQVKARCRRRQEARVDLLSLLLRQLSGIPRRETVVRGTRQSGDMTTTSPCSPSASVDELSL